MSTPRRIGSSRNLRRRGERGAELVEMAFALPILLTLLLGIIWFARAYNIYETMTRAAREGARVAANEFSDFGTLNNNCASASCVAAVAESVSNYLQGAGVQPLCTFNTTTTWSTTTFSGTFTASGGGNCSLASLQVERAFAVGGGKKNTRVTLTYPNPYTMGGLLSLLTPGSTTNLPPSMTSDAIMPNIN